MGFGDRDGAPIPFPGLLQDAPQAEDAIVTAADGVDVDVGDAVVLAQAPVGDVARDMPLHPMVQQPLAGEIVVHADDVGGAGVVQDPAQALFQPAGDDAGPERVIAVHHAAQQVPPRPPPIVLIGGFALERGRGVAIAEVIGLNQPRSRVDPPDFPHRQAGRVDFVQKGGPEGALVRGVGIPVAVERAEPGRGQGFVHRRPLMHPRVTLGGRPGVGGEAGRKILAQQVRVSRPAAVVAEGDDGPHPQLADAGQALVGPAEVSLFRPTGGDALPQGGVAQRANAERGEEIEVAEAVLVAAPRRLVVPMVPHAVDRAFVAAP